jgi:hypothetical protein
MREELFAQYGAIRETIRTNIQTIGKLIQQAQSLKEIVAKITDNLQVKTDLEGEINQIEQTIANLIQQTDRLFDSYNEFVKKVFEQK